MKKRNIILIDDLFNSSEMFLSIFDERKRVLFDKNYFLEVFDYKPNLDFNIEKSRILKFLQKHSNFANILLLDMMFPSEDRGGLKIIEMINEHNIEIPYIIIFSSSDDLSIPLQLRSQTFIHRKKELDIEALTVELDKIFAKEKLFHPQRGVLISHGTDTLSYILEVLKYGIKDLEETNIIVTGSQISMGEVGSASDAIDNIRSSVLLLQHLYAPTIGAVFNRGENFFKDNIQKKSKWHPMAFEGEVEIELDWDRFKQFNGDFKIKKLPRKLEDLYLFRTGGTIESIKDSDSGFKPGGDFIAKFITGNMENCYHKFHSIPFSSLDSSNMCIDDWINLLTSLNEELNIKVDLNFEKNVGLLVPSPFIKTSDYLDWMNKFEGIVIAGYGAGNANTMDIPDYEYSLLKAVKEYTVNHPVVLASIIPEGKTDFVYEVALEFIKVGCIPSGHLSYQASLVRLSYLLGHKELFGKDHTTGIREWFVQGLKFRSDESKSEIENLLTYFRYKTEEDKDISFEDFKILVKNNSITKSISLKNEDPLVGGFIEDKIKTYMSF